MTYENTNNKLEKSNRCPSEIVTLCLVTKNRSWQVLSNKVFQEIW